MRLDRLRDPRWRDRRGVHRKARHAELAAGGSNPREHDDRERGPRLILRKEAGRIAEGRPRGGLAHHAWIARAAAVAFGPEAGPNPVSRAALRRAYFGTNAQ